MVPLRDLFVNRTREIEEFALVLAGLRRGRRRHLALLGLRRIGKTVLLDEVRRRHPDFPICYVALDDLASSPAHFATSLVGQLLATGATARGSEPLLDRTDEALIGMAAALDPKLVALVREILGLIEKSDHGALLSAVMRFPGHISELLGIPLLVMMDEFQEIVRLRQFPGTVNLLGAVRAALDRPGRVGYAIAGSRVTALRELIGGGESPLFTRFSEVPVGPFGLETTAELAMALWQEDPESDHEPDAVVRLYRLSGGWPLYVHAIAIRAQQHARTGGGKVTQDLIDLAFREELFGRLTHLGQHCAYLRQTATASDSNMLKSLLEEVLRQVALHQPLTRPSLVRRLVRRYNQTDVYRAVNRLIDTDFLAEENRVLTLLDSVFALWLASEPARQDPQNTLAQQRGVNRLIAWYEQRHAEDRTVMGGLFEKRVENLARQFGGQEVDGTLLGVSGIVTLPVVRRIESVRVADPKGLYGDAPDSYEIDLVTVGDRAEDCWAIEAKHRRGALTVKMVERFLRTVRSIEKASGLTFHRLWIVANRGIRSEARSLIQVEGVLTSGGTQIERLERLAAGGWIPPAGPGT